MTTELIYIDFPDKKTFAEYHMTFVQYFSKHTRIIGHFL